VSHLLERPRAQPATPLPAPRPGLLAALARVALVPVRALGRLERTLGARSFRSQSTQGTRSLRRPAPRRRRGRILRLLLIPVVALAVFVGVTLVPALAAPGADTTAARVAEWAREWGLGALVTTAEQVRYEVDKPTTGGVLAGGIPTTGVMDTALPPIAALAQPALAGEGQWQDLLKNTQGRPVARVAFLRPDSTHTGFSVGVVQLDATRLSFGLHQGTHVPGGQVVAPTSLTTDEKKTVLATFNSGFQMKDATGGYYQNGTTLAPLVTGAASMVFDKNGSLKVEPWADGTPTSDVAAVRQNLVMLVDKGQVNPQVDAPDTSTVWGKTVGNKAYVWRTAVGTRADGSVIFIVGPALNVATLASLAKDAGCVEAMELDINTDWTNFIWYSHAGTAPTPHKLTADEFPDASRYLSASTRDFVAVLPR
jgi:Phosphodiester glycosidase